jgi:hypothetical protein
VDNCQSCHDGVFATGKSTTHVPTNQDCGVCHTTSTFIGAVFDHTGIVNNCASCHNGVTARGKHPDHIPTTLDCSNCHTTATFIGGTFDHQGITGGCSSCHNGTTAIGKSGTHFITTQECNVCHSTQAWAPINYTHAASTDYPGNHNSSVTCVTCHGNSEIIVYDFPQYAGFCASCHANDFTPRSNHNGGSTGTVEQNKDCSGGGSGCHRVSSRDF